MVNFRRRNKDFSNQVRMTLTLRYSLLEILMPLVAASLQTKQANINKQNFSQCFDKCTSC